MDTGVARRRAVGRPAVPGRRPRRLDVRDPPGQAAFRQHRLPAADDLDLSLRDAPGLDVVPAENAIRAGHAGVLVLVEDASETVVGFTLVALGTSRPELVTAVQAQRAATPTCWWATFSAATCSTASPAARSSAWPGAAAPPASAIPSSSPTCSPSPDHQLNTPPNPSKRARPRQRPTSATSSQPLLVDRKR